MDEKNVHRENLWDLERFQTGKTGRERKRGETERGEDSQLITLHIANALLPPTHLSIPKGGWHSS
jgi:hypothetical protein